MSTTTFDTDKVLTHFAHLVLLINDRRLEGKIDRAEHARRITQIDADVTRYRLTWTQIQTRIDEIIRGEVPA